MPHHPDPLFPVAYRAAAQVLHSPVMAEEASERALHLLTLAVLQGCPPDQPKAWLRVVARRSAAALLRSDWARSRSIDPELIPSPAGFEAAASRAAAWVRERLPTGLTPRQRAVLEAAMRCRTTRGAARSCGMQPRDFRRSLGSICRRARAMLGDDGGP